MSATTISVSSTTPDDPSTPEGSLHKAPMTGTFFDATREGKAARAVYLKIFLGGSFMILILIFGIMSIFWGSLWKIPAHNLHGWIVDFDGGSIGQRVIAALSPPSSASKITWTVVPASEFPGGALEVGAAVLEEHAWIAVTINAGSTEQWTQSLLSPNATYDGSDALTVFATEARNENAFRIILHPTVQTTLDSISKSFAAQAARQASNASNLATILAQSPQTITSPISYTIVNMAPFNVPVATAVTFVGLIYQIILSFFVVMIGQSARDASGLTRTLSTQSLIRLRFTSSFAAYFGLSLFYCLLSLSFQMDFSLKFGHSGFLVFWMLNYVGMLALGLALESLITLLTVKFIPFFMLTWIITNVSVATFPIEVLPAFFRYGYAMPFYNVSHAMRTIVFGTKNRVGFNFGILLIWVAISVVTLPLIQWFVRRPARAAAPPVPDLESEIELNEKKDDREKELSV